MKNPFSDFSIFRPSNMCPVNARTALKMGIPALSKLTHILVTMNITLSLVMTGSTNYPIFSLNISILLLSSEYI
jgi:hypothetical protein